MRPDPERCRAVLFGTSDYRDAANLPPIPAVRKNLDDMRAVLSDPNIGLFKADHCTLILDEPDLFALGHQLQEAMTSAEDVLLVYFAGHGIIGRRHDLYLGMPNSNLSNPALVRLRMMHSATIS